MTLIVAQGQNFNKKRSSLNKKLSEQQASEASV